jgi:hypothetical protein
MSNNKSDIRLLQFSNYVRPDVVEEKSKDWVLNGKKNSFYQYIIDRYNGSPTNAAIINSYIDLILGKGLIATNAKSNIQDWVKFRTLLSSRDLRRIIADFQLFGEASIQVVKNKGKGLSGIYHIPKQYIAPQIENEDGEIEGYWYTKNWAKVNQNPPEYFPAFGTSNEAIEIMVIKPYKAGKNYYSDPDYLAGLPYAMAEEEIANYYVSHIENGLSFGYIINIPNGNSLSEEEKTIFERQIKNKLTGSSNAGKFVLSFNGVDAEITVTSIEVNDAHKQWEYLTNESRRQLLISHRVTSPMLFGIKDNTGLGNNADELDVAEAQLMKRVISPKQNYITMALEEILSHYGIVLELEFKPLSEVKSTATLTEMSSDKCNKDCTDCDCYKKKSEFNIDTFLKLGEDIDDTEWTIVDDRRCDEMTIDESQLNSNIELASTPKTSNKKDVQDTKMFKVRYRYAGSKTGEREFCNKVLQSNKVYRSEDLNANYNYNEEFAPKGKDSYNIFLYKGGVNCKHFWERVIYLKANNERISVNNAMKLINSLEPKDRKDERLIKNPKEVAQVAEKQNNYWSLKPNYRG